MALSYRIPSIFCEPTSVCSVCVCTVYGDTQHYRGSSMAEQGNRKPPFTLLVFCLSFCLVTLTPRTPPPPPPPQPNCPGKLRKHIRQIESIHAQTLADTCEAVNKTIAVRSRLRGRGIAQRTCGRGGQIPFHLSDQYVPYLAGCNGTQLGWNEYELIN